MLGAGPDRGTWVVHCRQRPDHLYRKGDVVTFNGTKYRRQARPSRSTIRPTRASGRATPGAPEQRRADRAGQRRQGTPGNHRTGSPGVQEHPERSELGAAFGLGLGFGSLHAGRPRHLRRPDLHGAAGHLERRRVDERACLPPRRHRDLRRPGLRTAGRPPERLARSDCEPEPVAARRPGSRPRRLAAELPVRRDDERPRRRSATSPESHDHEALRRRGNVATDALAAVARSGTSASIEGNVVAGGGVHVRAKDNLSINGIAGSIALGFRRRRRSDP